jgi:hypothetical protein
MSNAWPGSALESNDPLGGGYGEEDFTGVGESFTDDATSTADRLELAQSLGEALRDEYAYATAEELDEALGNVLGSLAPAEAYDFARGLQQAGKSARRVLEDPALAQIAKTALPLAGGALGGPAGMALGSGLGNVAAQALAPRAKPPPGGGAPLAGKPPVAAGSPAAATGFLLSQTRPALLATLATAMGDHGSRAIDGVQVAEIMRLLSEVYAEAARDADELQQGSSDASRYPLDGESDLGPPVDGARALYTALVAAETEALSEAVDLR